MSDVSPGCLAVIHGKQAPGMLPNIGRVVEVLKRMPAGTTEINGIKFIVGQGHVAWLVLGLNGPLVVKYLVQQDDGDYVQKLSPHVVAVYDEEHLTLVGAHRVEHWRNDGGEV